MARSRERYRLPRGRSTELDIHTIRCNAVYRINRVTRSRKRFSFSRSISRIPSSPVHNRATELTLDVELDSPGCFAFKATLKFIAQISTGDIIAEIFRKRAREAENSFGSVKGSTKRAPGGYRESNQAGTGRGSMESSFPGQRTKRRKESNNAKRRSSFAIIPSTLEIRE